MKIATWNVNGIRKRQTELQDWLDRVQPDVVCLQEIKATIDQLPVWLCEIDGYWCYWHGGKGYSGVGLHVSKRLRRSAAGIRAPSVRLREPHRLGAASRRHRRFCLRSERREGLSSEGQVSRGARAVRRRPPRRHQPDRDLRRPEHRASRHRRPSQGAQAARDRPASRRARPARTDHRPRPRRRRAARSSPTTIRCSPGGRPGGTCASGTSDGASTTCWPASACSSASEAARSNARPARAITRRSSGNSRSESLIPDH